MTAFFQSVLFTDFFDQIEKPDGIKPGQPEHDLPAPRNTLLKQSVELLKPLREKIFIAAKTRYYPAN